jgi:hypothetical protein
MAGSTSGLTDEVSETYDRSDCQWIEREGVVTEVNDGHDNDAKPETERTVTVAGKPLLVAGVVAFLSLKWIRRRIRRRGTSAP